MKLKSLAAGIALGLASIAAAAQASYPSKAVTIVVPFAAGGPTDTVARQLGASMAKSLGQSVIIENVGGAGGTIGVKKVIDAPNDGHTVLLMHIGISTAPALYRTLKYDVTKDLEPIGLVVDVPMTMIANKALPANDFKEFLAYIKANKDKVAYGNAGLGSASHLCGTMFMSAIDTDFVTVPYKGTGPAMTDLLGGQIQFMCDQSTNTTSQIKAGAVKAFAATSLTRVAALPDLPTMDESGLKGFSVGVWHGVWTPKGTPKAVNDKLNAALRDALKDEAVVKKFADLGATPEPVSRQNPESLRAHLAAEIAKWGPVLKKAGKFAD